MIEALPADGRRAFREFIRLPFKLYDSSPQWVPPLLREIKDQFSQRNPFLGHAKVQPFIAVRRGKTIGRIVAILNQGYIDQYGSMTGFFGFFESVDEEEVARALFEAAGQWLLTQGMERMQGPMNFSSNEEWGSLIEGFDEPPMVMMPYNAPYHQSLYETCDFVKAKDLYAYIAEVPDRLPEKVYRVARVAEKQGITVRQISIRSLESEMRIFRSIYNSAWEKNWGFMPLTDEEIAHTARRLKPVIVPELALIAECKGEPVGFMMFLPDYNYVLKRLNGRLLPFGVVKALYYAGKISDARLLLLGIRARFRRRGVDSLLFMEGLKGLHAKGFRRMELSWVLEDNYPVQRVIETMQGRLYKKYRLYECGL